MDSTRNQEKKRSRAVQTEGRAQVIIVWGGMQYQTKFDVVFEGAAGAASAAMEVQEKCSEIQRPASDLGE